MPAIEQKQHGGKREGSGRKPLHDSAKVHVWCRLSQDVIDWLGKQDESSGEIIDAAVRRCQAFRRGKASGRSSRRFCEVRLTGSVGVVK
jgi:hypothetical protein